jgi:nicotinamide riboside kinase
VDVQDNLHVEAAAKLALHCSSLELIQSMVLGTAAESEIKVSRRFALIFMNTNAMPMAVWCCWSSGPFFLVLLSLSLSLSRTAI